MPTPTNNEALREQLAAIEHERWSDWQKWCHKVLRENCPSAELEKVLQRWDKQIATPYTLLTAAEKASDMEQVDRYWPLIEAYTTRQVVAELEEIPMHPNFLPEYIKDRIAVLTSTQGKT